MGQRAAMAAVLPVRATPPLAQIALAFARRRVLLVGDLVADHYIYGQTDRVSREAPVLIVRHESSEVKLGGGRTWRRTCARCRGR